MKYPSVKSTNLELNGMIAKSWSNPQKPTAHNCIYSGKIPLKFSFWWLTFSVSSNISLFWIKIWFLGISAHESRLSQSEYETSSSTQWNFNDSKSP